MNAKKVIRRLRRVVLITQAWRRGSRVFVEANTTCGQVKGEVRQSCDERLGENGFYNAAKDAGSGRITFKWDHYFDIYERELSHLRGRRITIVEIGILEGGSLRMWRHALGANCVVYGVDINPNCQRFEEENTRIVIGDQGDRRFWSRFKDKVSAVDVVIDDGSHIGEHQITTFEELWPIVRPGGLYICEDVHGEFNEFFFYVVRLASRLNGGVGVDKFVVEPDRVQMEIERITMYPYLVAIKKRAEPLNRLFARKVVGA